jgi:hypothetical protein
MNDDKIKVGTIIVDSNDSVRSRSNRLKGSFDNFDRFIS